MSRKSTYEYSMCESKLHDSKMGQNASVSLICFSTQFPFIKLKNVLLDACIFNKLWGGKKNRNELDKAPIFKESIIFWIVHWLNSYKVWII